MTRVNMTVSNGRARRDLGWTPRYPSYLEGITASARQAGLVANKDHGPTDDTTVT